MRQELESAKLEDQTGRGWVGKVNPLTLSTFTTLDHSLDLFGLASSILLCERTMETRLKPRGLPLEI
jgi:hypothetical protein